MIVSVLGGYIKMIDKKQLGKQLKELRKKRGWRQDEVADKVGLSRPAISNIESGNRALTLTTLKKFCELYQIDITYFGLETKNFDENVDLIARLDKIFSSNDIPKETKDDLYTDIMRIYLRNKK